MDLPVRAPDPREPVWPRLERRPRTSGTCAAELHDGSTSFLPESIESLGTLANASSMQFAICNTVVLFLEAPMMTVLRGVFVGLAAVAAVSAPARAADILYVRAAHVIVDASLAAVSPGAIVITDGVITAAGAPPPVPAGAREIDLGALTIIPSLLDAHTHLGGGPPRPQPGQPTPLPSAAYAALQAQRSVASALNLGIAAMRVLGTSDFLDVAIKNAIDDGLIPGPLVIPAAHPLSIIGGHDDFAPLPYTMDVRDLYTPLHGYVAS